jgi:N-acyl-D-aspartate/D-glutamate deacylase
MTSLPAQVLGLRDRGLLRKGYWADIVVFDPDRVADTATYDNPKQYPKGIDYVLVNGAVVIDNGNHTGARPGKVVYGPENEAHENVRPVFQLKSQIADKLADSRNKPRFGRVHGSLNS